MIDCISGLYVNECNFNCSQFCHDQLFYGATGEYVNGCEDGYIGGLCKTRKISVATHDFFCISDTMNILIGYI